MQVGLLNKMQKAKPIKRRPKKRRSKKCRSAFKKTQVDYQQNAGQQNAGQQDACCRSQDDLTTTPHATLTLLRNPAVTLYCVLLQ